MNDDTRNPLHELASAYLDGDVSADERARAEGSPEVRELVESFRRLRVELADAPPASAAAREAAVAAALAAFDRSSHAEAAATTPVVHLATRRRRWPATLLSAAAAAAVVGVIGTVVLNDGNDGLRDSAKTGDQEMNADVNRSATADSTPTAPTISSINDAASAVPVIANASELLGFASTSPEMAPTAGGTPDTTVIVADTQVFGARDCALGEDQVVVGDIIWIDAPAIAVRDTVTGVVQAIDDQCNVLVAAEP